MKTEDIKVIAIAGAGVMGASMAQIFAQYNYDVVLYDIADQFLEKGRNLIEVNQATQVETGDISIEKSQEIVNHISYAPPKDMTCFKTCDMVVECIVENLDIKHEFWKAVSEMAKEDCILTTNTSGLSITEIAKAVYKPERFCGMHWFNPPHIIPLIEVINGDQTDQATADVVYEISEKIGKKPIYVAKDALGFIANRIQLAILRECIHIKEQGIGDFQDIDRCMKYGLGFRYACLGPFEVVDFGGIDTFHHIASYLWEDLSNTDKPTGFFDELYKNGCYGVKSKKGFYDYSNGKDVEVLQRRDEMYLKLFNAHVTD